MTTDGGTGSTDGTHGTHGTDDLLLSDAERLHALTVLGDHYAAGRLDDPEFHARSGDAAAARRLGDLTAVFRGLPGGVPLQTVDGAIVQAATGATAGGELVPASSSSSSSSSSSPAVPSRQDAERELEDLRKRGKTVESWDGVVIGATLVTFLILQFVVGWPFAWIVWPSLALTLGIPRAIMRFTDDDEELYDELMHDEAEERKERLHAANKRIRELGDGRERPAG